ncbi:MAG TPA: esterase-like activity of phytase family protein, partial [Thermoanaerobaculia bacterium]|nr:esterase-like activity of phytase family protein [Thermoanaerobaculia bacterium]
LFDVNKAGFLVDNLEGMTLGPKLPDGDRTLVLIADNNFERFRQFQEVVALRLHSVHSATRAGS